MGELGEPTKECTIIIHPAEEGGYWTEVPALDGIVSQGETLEEAIAMTKDAIEGVVESLRAHGDRSLTSTASS